MGECDSLYLHLFIRKVISRLEMGSVWSWLKAVAHALSSLALSILTR